MTCPHCRTAALSPDQRYCHACGALLAAPPARYEGNAVGDGSARPLVLPPAAALGVSRRQPGRLVLLGGGVALAVIALAIVVVTLVSAAIVVLSALMPVIVFIAVFSLAARPRRRRRHRHRHRSRGPVVWL